MTVRTRIAPSPTGEDFHIGNAYTALINYVFATKHQGDFLVRIEDTDRARLVEGSEQRIFSSLEWLGIPHAEGPDVGGPHAPYRQSERLALYTSYVDQLIANGHAYYAFETPAELEAMRKEQEAQKKPPMYDGPSKYLSIAEAKARVEAGERYVVRLRVPDSGTSTFVDAIRGEISFENVLIDDQVLLKSDGFPTYHLAVVVDDHLMGITHIIRGEEWISSTPKHILLYQFFGWEMPQFAHLSVLRNPDRSKLSKRKNPVWVSMYKEKGYLPEAIKNYLATMAWSYPDGRDIFSVEEMIAVFDIAKIQTTAPIFDIDKLRWMNGEYLRRKTDDELVALLTTFDARVTDSPVLRSILPLVRERMKTLSEFWQLAGFFYEVPHEYDEALDKNLVTKLHEVLSGVSDWTHDSMEQAVRELATAQNQSAKTVFMQLRLAVTGKKVGPPLLESLEVLGKEESLRRLA